MSQMDKNCSEHIKAMEKRQYSHQDYFLILMQYSKRLIVQFLTDMSYRDMQREEVCTESAKSSTA